MRYLDVCSGISAASVAWNPLGWTCAGFSEVDAGQHADSKPHVAYADMVRRITPTEAERLMGVPEGYTLIPYRGKPAKDSPRYRAMGNSIVTYVLRWIGERIAAVEALMCVALLLSGCAPKQPPMQAKTALTYPPACRVWGCVTIWNEYGADRHGMGIPWGMVHTAAQGWADRTGNRWAWIESDGERRLMDLAPTAVQDCWTTYGAVTITPAVLCAPSDVNCDGATNSGDVLAVRAGRNWNQRPPKTPRADVNGDGIADAADLLVIRSARNWNTTTGECECQTKGKP